MPEVVIKTPTPDSTDHDKAMAAKADQGTNINQPREQLLAGKYKTEDDLHKGVIELLKKQHGNLEDAYKNLERAMGKSKEEHSASDKTPRSDKTSQSDKAQDQHKDLKVGEVEAKAKSILEQAGLNLEDFNAEFAKNGELSQESYEKLEKAGFPKAMVDAYIEGQKVLAEKFNESVFKHANGEETYFKMIDWARENLSKEEIIAYDKTFDSGDMRAIELAVDGLFSRYERAVGRPPQLFDGSSATNSVGGFESWAQVTAAMKDARYGKDPAYTRGVEERLRRSNL